MPRTDYFRSEGHTTQATAEVAGLMIVRHEHNTLGRTCQSERVRPHFEPTTLHLCVLASWRELGVLVSRQDAKMQRTQYPRKLLQAVHGFRDTDEMLLNQCETGLHFFIESSWRRRAALRPFGFLS